MPGGLPGRNDPCPCGSGKKYKKCCIGADAASRAKEQAARPSPAFTPDGGEDPLDRWSNAARQAIEAGRLDHAEVLCTRLIETYPDVPDGYELRGLIRGKQGRWKEAAQAHQQALTAAEAMGTDTVDKEMLDCLRGLRDAAQARAGGS